jgi:hypothetical protein
MKIHLDFYDYSNGQRVDQKIEVTFWQALKHFFKWLNLVIFAFDDINWNKWQIDKYQDSVLQNLKIDYVFRYDVMEKGRRKENKIITDGYYWKVNSNKFTARPPIGTRIACLNALKDSVKPKNYKNAWR